MNPIHRSFPRTLARTAGLLWLAPLNLGIAAPGELSFVLCLLLAPDNDDRWREPARAAAEASPRAVE